VTRVVGLGAPVGDDAVGFAVARELVRRGIDARELAEPSALVPILQSGPVIVVDALLSSGPPGRVVRLSAEELATRDERPLSTHGVGVAQAIALARALGASPDVVLVGVTISRAVNQEPLSPEVARAVPEAVNVVLGELGRT
jgi:hydrogenase maturation protease